ncbi:hypothetical protein [Mucilaginibacter segetis]|uniref:Uncharacterized protein n=1 Tax=Mucilaginibacter segetis TaxID=2793071 RepID=A0A934PXN6_9SPHI|nr:hypothetical protein [Mucilaginibacter segetis]MBK0380923.1 hypothetical protein [Mucilaginibacter segetis]
MNFRKLFLLLLFFPFSLAAIAQTPETVFLKWKLKPGEVLAYKTIMETDTTDNKGVLLNGGLINQVMGSDSSSGEVKKLLKQLTELSGGNGITTFLRKSSKNDGISVEMVAEQSKGKAVADTSYLGRMHAMIQNMTGGVMLRGELNTNGSIKSFYLKNQQKNLVAVFFELPVKAVKKGDKWSLDVNLIAMDQSFQCDSAYKKNEVTLSDIVVRNGEHVAKVKYDICEYVSGNMVAFGSGHVKMVMKVAFNGTADFSIEKGRWIRYEGLMSNMSKGFMSSDYSQKFALIPVRDN